MLPTSPTIDPKHSPHKLGDLAELGTIMTTVIVADPDQTSYMFLPYI